MHPLLVSSSTKNCKKKYMYIYNNKIHVYNITFVIST